MDQIILFLRFRLRARHRQGRGVHPPFAFGVVREVLFGDGHSGLQGIEQLRKSMLGKRDKLIVSDLGAGSHKVPGKQRSLRNLVRHTAISRKKGQLIARLARHLKFPLTIEMGTGTGISGLYLGMSQPESRVLTCEGSPGLAFLARQNFLQMNVLNVEVSNDAFIDWLPGVLSNNSGDLLVFLDGDHRGDRVLGYFNMIIDSGFSKLVLVLDDIHWSKDMNTAWKIIIGHAKISLSLETYNMGIIFIGYDIQKDHFVVNF